MKLENIVLTITKIESDLAVDKEGYSVLKCKGYNAYNYLNSKGKKRIGYNFFSTIRLYLRNNEQAEETKRRLYEQDSKKPRIKISAEDCELYTNIINGKIFVFLNVGKYDFFTNKMFPKKKRDKNKGDN